MYYRLLPMNNQSDNNTDKNKNTASNAAFSSAFALGWEMGYTITVPLVLFALLGRFADKYFSTSPVFLLTGIILSIFVSVFLLYHKVKRIIKEQEEGNKT
ncbi:MAG: hypothetical protein UU22_C0002G0019 [Parcubacteria group bacterium GW2011_GWA2_40_8]|nr:MAG: hypothetical protein UT82_C0001G0029 [Parcubacteria group bacterium GW2011_GWB1_40_14]KKR79192.1 MAG: hypothetical protein UU22_C0002G0019 [Parcubacteria group bacterium GW2011_GWA2_40_8]